MAGPTVADQTADARSESPATGLIAGDGNADSGHEGDTIGDLPVLDVCAALNERDILPVLTLDPATLRMSGDEVGCTIRSFPEAMDDEAPTDPPGEIHIERRRFNSHAEAIAHLRQEQRFVPVSHAVRTTDLNDLVLMHPDRRGETWVVHESTYVALVVVNATAAARSLPGWPLRVQRLALSAAGATIVSASASVSLAPATFWMPPPHEASGFAWLIDPIVAAQAFLAKYRFVLLPLCILIPLLSIAPAAFWAGRQSKAGLWLLLLIPPAILNVTFGPWLAAWLLYHMGVAGSATVAASRETAVHLNDRDVLAHTVFIRTADGRVVETEFGYDDVNVYPEGRLLTFPNRGDVFTVRYLDNVPRMFVIVADDGSPWAKGLRCGGLQDRVSEITTQLNLAPTNSTFRAEFDEALEDARLAGCAVVP